MAKPPRPSVPKLTPPQVELWDRREEMLYDSNGHLKVKKSDFNWFDVYLGPNAQCKIQVSYPLSLQHPNPQEKNRSYYVPVTASETWEIARLLGYYPLTSFVFDQTFVLAMAN